MTTAREQDKPSPTAARPGAPLIRRARAAGAVARALARRVAAGAGALLEAERRRLPLWAPVCLGLGIWLYFALPAEPSGWLVAAAVAFPAAAAPAAWLRGGRAIPMALLAAAFVSAGFAAAAARASLVAAPVLAERVDATVEGRVTEITRSRGDRRRLTLTDVVIYGLPRGDTPRELRVTLLEGDFARKVEVGERVSVFARLGPPEGPVEPGGFDFRRHAWFDGLGAVGYARGPLVEAPPGPGGDGFAARLGRWRGALTDGVLAALPGREGGFAAAILTGSRAEVHQEELRALRDSNLAHLLAISGLHMGLLAALVFAVVRLGLAAAGPLALRLPSKKVAAGAALAAAAAYLALSGASVATQRAFLMAATALIAVMIDRPAISLRALAAAALVILLLRPESLLDAGFQMSFAAATALIAVYEKVRERELIGLEGRPRARRVLLYLFALALTSLVAGLATAPYSAASFNRLSSYGLIANLAAVPIMASFVMPMGALAAALAPLGLHAPALWLMGQGIAAILWIAEAVAGLPGAVGAAADPPAGVMPLLTLGALWLALWSTRLRWLGLAPAALALGMWLAGGARPPLLIAPHAAMIGALGPEGRALDRERGAGYVADSWLQADGDLAGQAEAALRPGLERADDGAAATLANGWRVELLRGAAPPARLRAACRERTLLVAMRTADASAADGPCRLLGRAEIERLGAISVAPDGGGVRLRGALSEAEGRLWGVRRSDEAGAGE